MDFIIGGLAGAGATIFSNPMDVVKIRLQMQGELGARGATKKQYKGVFHALYVIAKNDGLMALQKGLAPAVLLGFTMNSVSIGDSNEEHKASYYAAVEAMQADRKKPKSADDILYLTVDLQQTTPLPKLTTYKAFYLRQLWFYNLGIHVIDGTSKEKAVCCTWTEDIADRGSSEVASALLRLGIYQKAEVHGWIKNKKNEVCLKRAIFWSGLGGMIGGFICNPASVVKTRLQTAAHPSIAVGRQHSYDGMIDGVRQIYKTEGLRGFFAGAEATCTRLAIGSAAQLTTFSIAKEALVANGICKTSPFGLAFAASAVSGVVVCVIVCPLDVTTVRLYNQGPAQKGKVLYTGFLDCLTKIYKIEGVHGLYKGIGPLYLRMAPHTTVSLVIWDMPNNLLQRNKKI